MIRTPTNTQRLLAMAKTIANTMNADHKTPITAAEFRIAVERRLIQIGTDTLDAVVHRERSYVVVVYLAPDEILPAGLRRLGGKTLLLSTTWSKRAYANEDMRRMKRSWREHRFIDRDAPVLTDVQCITTKGKKP